jgi:hypothetical protein
VGFLDGLRGNASEMKEDKLEEELEEILIEGESIEGCYKILRDYFVFTNKRLILVDKQGVTGTKKEYHSIPYKNIRHFSIESAGTFDRDSELKLWIAGINNPLQKQFGKKSSNILEVQKALAKHILK